MENLNPTETIIIAAPPEKVWEILVSPKYMRQWYMYAAEVDDVPELKPGNEIRWKDDAGNIYAKGTILEIEPMKMIKTSAYFYSWDKPVGKEDLTDSYILEEKNGKVILTHTYGDFSKVPNGVDLYKDYLSSVTPQNMELVKIKNLAEQKISL